MKAPVLIMVCLSSTVLSFGVVRWAVELRAKTQSSSVASSEVNAAKALDERGPSSRSEAKEAGVPEKNSLEKSAKLARLLQLISELERGGSSLADSRLAVFEAINGMSKEDLKLLVEQASTSADFTRMFRYDVRFAAQRLGELDPKVATAMWEERGTNVLVASAMLAPWAARDPQAFAAWVKSLPANQQSSTSWALQPLAQNKPESFAILAPLLSNSPAGPAGATAAIQKMMSDAGDKGDSASALAYANSLPEGAIRDRALANMAKWPGMDLAKHPEVLAAVGNLPDEIARQMGVTLSANASKLPEGPARESAFSNALKGDTDRDPAAATKRLDELAGSKDYPAAVLGFVDATAGKDPAAAADWALSIGANSASVRQQALEKLAQVWKIKDAEEARAWVEKAPLTDREYFILTGRTRSK
ncbi:MAG: hypothetical protein WCO60_07245 [Verrucomicrobiota bacterium]